MKLGVKLKNGDIEDMEDEQKLIGEEHLIRYLEGQIQQAHVRRRILIDRIKANKPKTKKPGFLSSGDVPH